MKKYLYLLIISLALLIACEEESTPTKIGSDPEIESITMQDKWNSASSRLSKIEVEVIDPQGSSNISGVFMQVTDQSSQVVFSDSLYDDGANIHTQDGDVFANDGIFSNRFSSVQILSGAADGEYEFSFRAIDNEDHQSTVSAQSALFGPDALPEVVNLSAPDTLFSANTGQFIYATANDDDGLDDILSVFIEVFDSSDLHIDDLELFNDGNYDINGDLFAGDSIFSIKLDSTYGADKIGAHKFKFHVKDTFDELNTVVPEHSLFIENFMGVILSTSVPDSVKKPTTPGTTVPFELNANVTDPQGLNDISSVYFLSQKPDGTFSGNGSHFDLYDDGDQQNYGDDIANDGEYSLVVQIADSNDPGVYKFHFYMLDQVGHLTDVTLDSIVVY